MQRDDMYGLDWEALLRKAEASWRDFLSILAERGEGDFRMADHFQAVREKTESDGKVEFSRTSEVREQG